jgi:hypothetical protein
MVGEAAPLALVVSAVTAPAKYVLVVVIRIHHRLASELRRLSWTHIPYGTNRSEDGEQPRRVGRRRESTEITCFPDLKPARRRVTKRSLENPVVPRHERIESGRPPVVPPLQLERLTCPRSPSRAAWR